MALFKRGQVWWMRMTYQGQQVRRSTEVTDKKLAEKIYHKVRTQIAEGKWFDRLPGEVKTVRELLERYLQEHSARNKAVTSYCSDQCLASNLLRIFGALTLVEVRPPFIAAYKAQRRAAGIAPKAINNELTLFNHAFTLAIKEWEWVTDNPVKNVSKEKVQNLIERWLSTEEEQRLLSASPTWLQKIILLAVHTGLRQSEILNLQWPLVDLFRKKTVTRSNRKTE